MQPAPSESSDLVNRLRQQLILAQVRIMELEDERDLAAGRYDECSQLLREAQALADVKVDENTHLSKVLADMELHISQLEEQRSVTASKLVQAAAEIEEHKQTASRLEAQLEEVRVRMAAMNARCEELETALSAIHSSRSWRWTAWLRQLGSRVRNHQP